MRGALALVVLVAAAVALAAAATAPTVFEIQLSPAPRDGVVVVEDGAGPVGVYAAQANGRVLVRVEGRGRHVARITSTSHAFAVLRFVVPADGGLLQAWADEPALVWSGDALMAVALGPARLFEERAVFSWMGLLQNPMVYMGLLSVVMMGMMQLMMSGLDLEDVRREMRGDPAPAAPQDAEGEPRGRGAAKKKGAKK